LRRRKKRIHIHPLLAVRELVLALSALNLKSLRRLIFFKKIWDLIIKP
jgi:hypothetical protein